MAHKSTDIGVEVSASSLPAQGDDELRQQLALSLDLALGELRMVDEALARRPALADMPDRYSKVFRACEMAGRAEAAEERIKVNSDDKLLADAQRRNMENADCGHPKKYETHGIPGAIGCLICDLKAGEGCIKRMQDDREEIKELAGYNENHADMTGESLVDWLRDIAGTLAESVECKGKEDNLRELVIFAANKIFHQSERIKELESPQGEK